MMVKFEYKFLAPCGTPLKIGTVENDCLIDAIMEIGAFDNPDADAVAFTIEEKRPQSAPVLDRGMHVGGGCR